MRLLTHPVTRVLLGLGLGLLVLLVALDRQTGATVDRWESPGDRVRAAIEGVRDDGVHVSPDGRRMLDEAAEAAIADTLAARDLPVVVVVWEPSRFAGYDSGYEAGDQIAWAVGQDVGHPVAVLLWQGPADSDVHVTPGWFWTIDASIDGYEEPEYGGEAALRVPEWLDRLPDDDLYERRSTESWGSSVAASVFLAGGVALVVWVLVGSVRVLAGHRFLSRPPRDQRRPRSAPAPRTRTGRKARPR